MADLLRIFSENLLPIFLAAGAGYLLVAKTSLDPRPITRLAFFLFAPCLIVRLIVDNDVSLPSLLRMGSFTMATLLALGAVTWGIARLLKWPRPLTAAAILVAMQPNAGNFGLSANLFAFGEPGLVEATLYFVTSSVLSYSLAVFVASSGRTTFAKSAKGLLRVPGLWAAVVGFAMVHADVRFPLPVERTVRLFADASIPVFLVVLGMQLHAVRRGAHGKAVAVATVTRLAGGAAVALLAAPLFGLEGVARQAAVLESAMPTAVITTIIATEYDAEPGFVTTVVLFTTLLSPLTLTPLLAYLGA